MLDVKPIPDGYSVITPYLIVDDAAGFIDFLSKAFGAVERLRIPMPGGTIGHAEVEINGAVLMVSDVAGTDFQTTRSLIHHFVEDVDSAYKRAIDAGATLIAEPETQFYGDRMGHVLDPSGNRWVLSTHVQDVDMDEVMKAIEGMGEG